MKQISNTIPTDRSVGRPTSYRPEFCQRVIKLMSEGRSLDGCAALLGVHPDSLYTWQKRHPEFSDAVKAGRAAGTAFWESRLLEIAQGGSGGRHRPDQGFTNRPTRPAAALVRPGNFAQTWGMVRPGGNSVVSKFVAMTTNV